MYPSPFVIFAVASLWRNLLVTNSYGDASMASLDSDYELVAVYNRRKAAYTISEKNLNACFTPKSDIKMPKAYLEKLRLVLAIQEQHQDIFSEGLSRC